MSKKLNWRGKYSHGERNKEKATHASRKRHWKKG